MNERLRHIANRVGGALRGASPAVLLLLGAVLLPAGPALAQTQPIVSNLGEIVSGARGGFGFESAGAFTTGRNASGYTLTNAVFLNQVNANSVTVSIYNDASGLPGTSLGTLTGPSTIASGHYTYTASRGIVLSPSTTYYVGVERAFVGSTNSMNQTSSDNWGIGDNFINRPVNGNWSIGGTGAMLFSISALYNLGFGNSTIADQTYTAGTAITDLTLPAAGFGSGNPSYMLEPDPPAGLSFDSSSNTRVLSGTPTTPMAAATYTYTATDVVGTSSTSLNFTIRVLPAVRMRLRVFLEGPLE